MEKTNANELMYSPNADTKKIIETSHHYYSLEKGIDSYFKIYNQLIEKE